MPCTRSLVAVEWITAFTALSLIAGCAYAPKPRIVNTATEYNVAVEETNNRMLLLNILRAKDRKPMYFTSVSALRGSISTEISAGPVEVPFGGAAKPEFKVTPGASFSTNPQFDVGVLDSEKFYRGVLAPIPPDTLAYYVQQRWPAELILHMFISHIDVVLKEKNEKGEKTIRFRNYPGYAEDQHDLKEFQKLVRALFNCRSLKEQKLWDCHVVLNHEQGEVIKKLPATGLGKLGDVVEATKAGWSIGSLHYKKDELVAYDIQSAGGYSFLLNDGGISDSDKFTSISGRELKDACLPSKEGGDKNTQQMKAVIDSGNSAKDDKELRGCFVYLRSPEAMLYYLGEIARRQLAARLNAGESTTVAESSLGWGCETSPYGVCIRLRSEESVPLFRIFTRQSLGKEKPEVEVSYKGVEYVVAEDKSYDYCRDKCDGESSMVRRGNSRSMHALSLVHQILSLQKSSDDLPSTQTVNVIGPK